MKISELANAAEVNVETIRYYQRRGLIDEPPRLGNGFRRYTQTHLQTLRFVRQAQALGFNLDETRELLLLRNNGHSDASEVKSRAEKKLAEIEMKLNLLEQIKQELHQLVEACPGHGSLDCCPIIESLEHGGSTK